MGAWLTIKPAQIVHLCTNMSFAKCGKEDKQETMQMQAGQPPQQA
jgi:hypothetical protein